MSHLPVLCATLFTIISLPLPIYRTGHLQVSTSIYDDLSSCQPVLHVLDAIFERGEVEAPGRFELSFKGLAQLPSQPDSGDGLATVTTYLYSAGYVPDHK